VKQSKRIQTSDFEKAVLQLQQLPMIDSGKSVVEALVQLRPLLLELRMRGYTPVRIAEEASAALSIRISHRLIARTLAPTNSHGRTQRARSHRSKAITVVQVPDSPDA
jgi:hypothetical protein